jgi:hypothetical protein
MRDCGRRLAAADHILPHPEERAHARVSKDGLMVRDGASRLLSKRNRPTASAGFAVWARAETLCRVLRFRHC